MANIKDVAKEAGVSVSTVSRVLRKEGYYSKEAKNKVHQAAKDLNYRVNYIGKSLKSKKSKIIGHLSFGSYSSPLFNRIASGINNEAYKHDYQIMTVSPVPDRPISIDDVKKNMDVLLSRQIEGLILVSPKYKHIDKIIEIITQENMPSVIVANPIEVTGINKVIVNQKSGIYKATNYLIEKGHKKIVLMTKGCGHKATQLKKKSMNFQRLQGYQDAFRDNNIEYDPEYIILLNEYKFKNGKQSTKKCFDKLNLDPTAILVTGEIMCMGVIQELYERKLRIPKDISIISTDDLFAANFAPPITSISQPFVDLGRKAVETILEKIDNEQSNIVKEIILEPTLVKRGSVKDLKS
ncbi:MAG: LacI family DNA-binding transcriptional regulator [Bacillota bacterium]